MNSQFSAFYDRFYLVFRGIFVFFLILFLLIPQQLIKELIKERKYRQQEVKEEILSKWASEQTIRGPLIMIPKYKDINKPSEGFDHIWIKPDELTINGNIQPNIKHRSIYSVVLYQSKLKFNGKFKNPAMDTNAATNGGYLVNKAQVVISISDYRGLTENIVLTSNGQNTDFRTNPYDTRFISNSISAPINLTGGTDTSQDFAFDLNIKGYEQINIEPYANKVNATINSDWQRPSFIGSILPQNQNTTNGFDAQWNFIDVRKTVPDRFNDEFNEIGEINSLGVKLLQGQDHYSKTERSIKYAILIITLTFVVYVFIELLQKKRINVLQYVLVGAALLVFYFLLLSISEYLGFNIAYAIASAAVILQISIYTGTVFKSIKAGFVFGILISALYVYIFSLIQLEDYALLAGSVGIFFILTLIMIFSRKIAKDKADNKEALEIKQDKME